MTSPTPPRSLCDQEDMEECASDRGPPCVPIVHRRWRVSQRFAPAMVYEPKKGGAPGLGACDVFYRYRRLHLRRVWCLRAAPLIVPSPLIR